MALNVTTAVIGSGCNTATATPSLAQWDQGQVLKIEGVDLPAAYQVEFSTEYTRNAIQKIGNANGVAVPNELLQRSAPITAYIVLHEGENDRETEYWITIHITPRTPPETVTPDPEEQSVIDETIAALQDGVAAAEAAAESVQNMGAEAETLPEGSEASVEKTVDPETGEVTLSFGIPKGTHGDPGYSPTIQIATITGGHKITVTDSQGSASFDVMDGEQGDPGAPGDDGYSPAVTITQITNGHRVTITDKTHQSGQTFDVMDGEQGDPGTPGDDGYSPAVTITTITGGHRVTITDKTHPSGQTFDVMDGVIQSVNGKSAASITLDSGDIEFDDSETYAAGSIGAEVSAQKNAIGELNRQLSDVTEITKNLCDINVLNKGGVVVDDEVATGTTSDFNNAFNSGAGGIPFGVTFKELTQYTLSFLVRNNSGSTSSANGQTVDVVYTDGTSKTIGISRNLSEYTRKVLTSDAGKTVEKFCFGYANSGTDVNNIKEMQLEEGDTASVYIPHVTATDFVARELLEVDLPEQAELIAENTEQIKIMNSWNDFSINYPATTKMGVTVAVTDGTLTATGTLTGSTYWDVYASTLAGAGLVAGKTYYADFGLHGMHVDGYITMYTNSGSGYNLLLNAPVGIVKTTIPANTQSILLRYFAPDSVPVNFSHKITFSEALPNSVLTNSAEMRFLRAWGTGDCTIIKFANGETLVIDFGLNEQQGTLQSSWQAAISEMKITHIDYAIISHYHADHIGMLLAGVGNLIDSDTVFFTAPLYTAEQLDGLAWMDSMSGDTVVQNYTDVQTVLNNAGVKRVYPTEGEAVCIGNALVQFWNCDHTEYLNQYIAHTMYDYNPCSLCNYITIGTQRVCFSGDISETVMTKYQTSVLPSQIFKVNHHSVGYAVVPLFLNSLMPDLDVTMLGHSFDALNVSQNQIWCEENFVPNVITGVNEKTLILKVTDNGYSWQNSVRKLVRADEGWTT